MRHLVTIALAAMMVFVIAAPGHAQGISGRRAADDGHHETGGHHDGHGHEQGHGGHHDHHVFRGPYVYWNPYPVDVQPTPGYWYYCPSAEAYYPYVTYCLDSWVPVPAR